MADTPTFESVEEIHAYYGRLLKDVEEGDPKRVALELEAARAEANVYKTEKQKLTRQSWTQKALSEFPRATSDDLKGDSEDEILASAKAAHDRIEEAIAEALKARGGELEEQAGRRAYGKVGVAGGGAPVVDAESPEAIVQRNQKAYEDRNFGGKPENPDKALKAHLTKIVAEKVG